LLTLLQCVYTVCLVYIYIVDFVSNTVLIKEFYYYYYY